MSDLFDALRNIKVVPKRHFVTIQGQDIEVSMEKKLEIIRNGEADYVLQDGMPVRRTKKPRRNSFREIKNFSSDPYWPTENFVWEK